MQKSGQEHARRLKAIRPFVNFNYNLNVPLTASAKKKIKKYYDEISALKARNAVVYRPRRKDRLKAAQAFAQHEKNLPGLRVAFIPTAQPGIAKIKVSRGKVPRFKVIERGIERESLPFNPRKLVRDPDGHVAELLATEPKATHFAVQAGRFEISAALTRERVAPRVKQLMERYSVGGERYKKTRNSSNHWKEWMGGINVYRFPDQASPGAYMQAKLDAARRLKKKRAKEKRDTQKR